MTASEQPQSTAPSRRALLAGALGGIGAWAASVVGRANPVQAGVDGDVVLGAYNFSEATTSIQHQTNSDSTVFFVASNVGDAVAGLSESGTAVSGDSFSGQGVTGSSETGWAGYFLGRVFASREIVLLEMSTPSAPTSNKAKLFIRDNGSGKTQLCVRFHTGAAQVLATQP